MLCCEAAPPWVIAANTNTSEAGTINNSWAVTFSTLTKQVIGMVRNNNTLLSSLLQLCKWKSRANAAAYILQCCSNSILLCQQEHSFLRRQLFCLVQARIQLLEDADALLLSVPIS